MKRVLIFDLDETLIDSAHRTPNRPDGTLDLERYLAIKSRETVFRDTLLPLASSYKQLCRSDNYIVICTARVMNRDDFDSLDYLGIDAHRVLCRPLDGSENHIPDPILKAEKLIRMRRDSRFQEKPFIMFDDSSPVISRIRQAGIVCLNANKINRRLKNL